MNTKLRRTYSLLNGLKHFNASFLATCFLSLFLLLALFGYGQPVPFKNFNVKEDGLPSSEVYHVMQDSKGFMWFSTDHGVCRFDGYQFKTFTTANGLADNTIFECKEDYKGRIWFRSYSGRLSYYYHDSIYCLAENENLVGLLHEALITSFGIDSSDNIYLATQLLPGIIKFDMHRKNSARLLPIPANLTYMIVVSGISQPIIGSSVKRRNLEIDTATPFKMYTISSRDSLLQMEYEIPLKREPKVSLVHIQALKLPDGETVISFGEKLVVVRYNRIVYQHEFTSTITKINFDNTGKVWIAFEENDPQCYYQGKIAEPTVLKVLNDKRISSLTTDLEGGLWITSLKDGVYYLSSLDFETRTKENGLPGNKVDVLKIAPDSSVWISTSPGNTLTVLYKDSLTYHTLDKLNTSENITSILFHNDKTIWVSSGNGILIYPGTSFSHPLPAQFDRGVKDMVLRKDNNVWVNCTGSINLFSRQMDSLEWRKCILPYVVVKKMLPEDNGKIWLGSLHGLYQYSDDSIINWGDKFSVLKRRIDDLALSSNGYLWIATRDSGIILKHNNHLSFLNTKNGLVSNFSHCLTFDYKGNVWVGTDIGISHIMLHYDKEENCIIDTIKNVTSSNLKEINCIVCVGNMVYTGTNNGLVSFNMNKIGINETPPPVYITSLKINNKNIGVYKQNLGLNYDENNIVINYVGLTYRDPLNTLYRYKLKGIDTGWVYTQYTVVQYPKLPPGNYSFQVSARNSDGVWSKDYASISFIISPPIWNVWWVKFLMSVVFICLVYWRISVVVKRERLKLVASQKVTEMELRELRGQLDPHFLFNNLNTLSYLVESKSPDAPVFVEELSKYFRYSLQSRNMEFTELKNELQQAERYIHLLKIRYGDKLAVKWEIDEKMNEYYISNHSLQLLLENIIKHNTVSEESPLYVEIATTTINTLIVKNNLQPKIGDVESTGLGLKSIDDRYHLLLKKNIKILRTLDTFYVELPLLTPKEYESTDY